VQANNPDGGAKSNHEQKSPSAVLETPSPVCREGQEHATDTYNRIDERSIAREAPV